MRVPAGPVTNILVGVNVAIWLVLWLTGHADTFAYDYGFTPALMSEAIGSGDFGAILWSALLLPLSSAFQHAGFVHLLFNMMMLLFTGRFVEFALGNRSFLILYFVSLYAASYTEYALNGASWNPIVGASGAISGILAAYMLLYASRKSRAWGPIPAFWARRISLFLFWTILNLGLGLFFSPDGSQIAFLSHIGGFLAGLLLVRPLLELRYGRDEDGLA